MNSSASLLAEQSIFAQLVIKKQTINPTKFQTATESSSSVYHYMTNETPYTSIDPAEYSITNLPDTTAYIPKNSIFDNIILIQKSSPDYRFVRIAPSEWINSNTKVKVVAGEEIAVKRFKPNKKPKSKIYTDYYSDLNSNELESEDSSSDDNGGYDCKRPKRKADKVSDDGSSEIPLNDDQPPTPTELNADNNENSVNSDDSDNSDINFDDSRFKNIALISDADNFSDLTVDVTKLLSKNDLIPKNIQWYDALLKLYNFNSAIENSPHLNNHTVTYKIIMYFKETLYTRPLITYTGQVIDDLKEVIDAYVQGYPKKI